MNPEELRQRRAMDGWSIQEIEVSESPPEARALPFGAEETNLPLVPSSGEKTTDQAASRGKTRVSHSRRTNPKTELAASNEAGDRDFELWKQMTGNLVQEQLSKSQAGRWLLGSLSLLTLGVMAQAPHMVMEVKDRVGTVVSAGYHAIAQVAGEVSGSARKETTQKILQALEQSSKVQAQAFQQLGLSRDSLEEIQRKQMQANQAIADIIAKRSRARGIESGLRVGVRALGVKLSEVGPGRTLLEDVRPFVEAYVDFGLPLWHPDGSTELASFLKSEGQKADESSKRK